MEIKKKYRCGNWIALLLFCTVLALTGCTRREEVFLEEITSEEDEEKSAGKNNEKSKADGEIGTVDENVGKMSEGSNAGIDESAENLVSNAPSETLVPQKIFVDVCGAVVNPGVYELDEGARIFQAVEAAGGYLPEAAINYLNRARSIGDGQQIYVPTEEEVAENLELAMAKVPEALTDSGNAGDLDPGEIPGSQTGNSSGMFPGDTGSSGDGTGDASRIDLNTADVGQLSTLSGIGQSKAESIIAYREEHGGFTSIEEIMNVEGIKEGTFSKIKDKISAG